MTSQIYIDTSGNMESEYTSPTLWRTPQMPYEFSLLSTEEMTQESNRVKKELERQLYGAIVKLGQDPATYDTDAHVVPEDEFEVNYPIKLDIARFLSTIAFIEQM